MRQCRPFLQIAALAAGFGLCLPGPALGCLPLGRAGPREAVAAWLPEHEQLLTTTPEPGSLWSWPPELDNWQLWDLGEGRSTAPQRLVDRYPRRPASFNGVRP
ncbi:hypothetical protein OOT46_14870 [Aquabacterium sp. A7-Y]|uniref:hypothetical protein n=1 Tax=Aquabacterium sp. A7-Y TaxID=1349605 RepID=UPI00223CD9D8|nr:hypothetical protein [Aquabacterium sp. A7-Y]MCW7539124.1 hypothetical protein [Aquabacterium sp. A7-Y]